jgi:hypothetical protein
MRFAIAVLLLSLGALAQGPDHGAPCRPDPSQPGGVSAGCQQAYHPHPLRKPAPAPIQAAGAPACTLNQVPGGGVKAGQTVTFQPSAECTSGQTFTLNCYDQPSCGTLTASGSFTGPAVNPLLVVRGGQAVPRNSLWTLPARLWLTQGKIQIHAMNGPWMARAMGISSTIIWHTNSIGSPVEVANAGENLATQVEHFYEGGWNQNDIPYLIPAQPFWEMQQGIQMPVVIEPSGLSFDNHDGTCDPMNNECDWVYKRFVDFQQITCTPGNPVTCNFQTDTRQLLAPKIWVWGWNSTDCTQINSAQFATVTLQPALNAGAGQLTIPVNCSGSTLHSLVVTAVNEGTGGPDGQQDNSQSGGKYWGYSNALLGGPNAAGTQMIQYNTLLAYDRVINNVIDPVCNCITAAPYASTTTYSNLTIAPENEPPAVTGDQVTYEHPFYPITGFTNSPTPTITTSVNFNNNEAPCMGNPYGSQNYEPCTAGMPLWVTISQCPAGPWAALNGMHLQTTAVDSGGATLQVVAGQIDTTGFGPLPAGCTFNHSWMPYGTLLLAKTKAEGGLDCDTDICTDQSMTCALNKATCHQDQEYGKRITDGAYPDSDSNNADALNTWNDDDQVHDAYGTGSAMSTHFQCPNPQGGGARSSSTACYEIIDPRNALVLPWQVTPKGTADGSTNHNRVSVCYGSTCADVQLIGPAIDCAETQMSVAGFAGNSVPAPPCWESGNANPVLQYTLQTPITGVTVDSNSGQVTVTSAITAPVDTQIQVSDKNLPCSIAPCGHIQTAFLPTDSSPQRVGVWIGAQDQNFTSCPGQNGNPYVTAANDTLAGAKLNFWGPISSTYCQRNWQADCKFRMGVSYAQNFGTFRANCSGWNGVTDGDLFGTSTSIVNDQRFNLHVNWPVVQLRIGIEAGYNTTGPGQNVFNLYAGGDAAHAPTLLAGPIDAWTYCGGAYKPCILGPYTVTMPADMTLRVAMVIAGYSTSQYEGTSLSWVDVAPSGPPVCQITVSPTTLPPGSPGQPYSQQLTATGNSSCAPPYTWALQ